MQIMETIRKISRPEFQLDPESYVRGYEDEQHPCYNCIIKGMCTLMCEDTWSYGADIRNDVNNLFKKYMPRTKFTDINNITYSTSSIIETLKTLKGKRAQNIHLDDEMYEYIQIAQSHLNRKRVIRKNYINKFGYAESSSAASGRSSSSCTSTKLRRKNENTNTKRSNVVPGLDKGQESGRNNRSRNYQVHRNSY